MASWRELIFTFGAYLTSSQLNQLQGNFGALAGGDPDNGAPEMMMGAAGDWTVGSSANGSLAPFTTFTPTAGLYTMIGEGRAGWQLFQGGSWRDPFGGACGVAAVDGSTIRLYNNTAVSATHDYAYFKYAGNSGSGWSWTGLLFSFGAYLTANEMLQLQDNFYAFGDGNGSAPKISNWDFSVASEGYFGLAGFTFWYPAAGMYTIAAGIYGTQQIFQASAWRAGPHGGGGVNGLCYMDGTNYRIKNSTPTITTGVAYIKHN